jgi:HEAT repeat protein
LDHTSQSVEAWVQDLSLEDEKDRDTRRRAYVALRRCGSAAVEPLREALRRGSAPRRYLVRALAELGPLARPALPEVLLFLKDPDVEVRRNAVNAVARIAAGLGDCLPPLLEAAGDPDPGVRINVAGALPFFRREGSQEQLVRQALAALSKDPDKPVSESAREAQARLSMGGESHEPAGPGTGQTP